jgi:serine/threonine protein kinase
MLKIGGFGEASKLEKTNPKMKKSYEDKYEQLLQLGEGGFGIVYRVQDRETKKYYCAKHINLNKNRN